MVSKNWLKDTARVIGYEYSESTVKGAHKYWLIRTTSTGNKVPLPFETLGDMQQFLVIKIKEKLKTR